MNRLSMLLLLIVICGGQYHLANGAIKSKQGSYTTYYVISLKEEGRSDEASHYSTAGNYNLRSGSIFVSL